MKRPWRVLVFGSLLIFSRAAFADMLEIRGRGYVNGEVLSDDGKKVQFRNSHGAVETLNKNDVLFFEKEDPAAKTRSRSGSSSGSTGKAAASAFSLEGIKEKASEISDKVTDFIQEKTPGLKKAWDDIAKPIRPSQTSQNKANMITKAINDAGDATVAMNKKTYEINRRMKENG